MDQFAGAIKTTIKASFSPKPAGEWIYLERYNVNNFTTIEVNFMVSR